MADKRTFEPEEMAAFAPAEKIGLVATVNPEGLPHVTLITSIRAGRPDQITLGEFCKGLSKTHLQQNPKAGFLIMTMDRSLWRGKARWTHLRNDGPEYEQYNDLPMFRYNAYFGINTVHYLDLISAGKKEALPTREIVYSSLLSRFAKGAAAGGEAGRILKPFAEALFNKLDSLKFISYVGPDGYPIVIPVVQCQAADSRCLVFSVKAYGAELEKIPAGTVVAVFGLTLAMEDVLVRGVYRGMERRRLVRLGRVDIDWVYNSMPPGHGQIYPRAALEPVTDF